MFAVVVSVVPVVPLTFSVVPDVPLTFSVVPVVPLTFSVVPVVPLISIDKEQKHESLARVAPPPTLEAPSKRGLEYTQ